MPKIIIHIGPHKTGTKYIQRRLDENAGGLLEQGIYVPTHWRDSPENPSHTKLAHALNASEQSPVEAEFESLLMSQHLFVVVSTESFIGCSNDGLIKLRRLLGETEYTIVFYIRRWSALIYSRWNQAIVGGETADFMYYAADCLTNPEGSDAINFGFQINRFVQVFGRQHIKLVSYDTVIENGGDIFRHFTRHFLRAPNVIPPTKARSNESTEPEKTELCRILNQLDQEAGNLPSARMIFALRRRRDIDYEPMLRYLRGFKRSIILRDDREPIRQILRRNRTEFSDMFVPPVPQNTSYEPKSVTVEFIHSAYLLAPGFPETIRSLYAELLK